MKKFSKKTKKYLTYQLLTCILFNELCEIGENRRKNNRN